MRISDWSSDVCSSDLIEVAGDRCVQAVIETGAQAFDQVDRLGYALALARHFAALHGALRLRDAIERTLHPQLDQPVRAGRLDIAMDAHCAITRQRGITPRPAPDPRPSVLTLGRPDERRYGKQGVRTS